jgi:DNA-binding CsgD family transcriptional regulator
MSPAEFRSGDALFTFDRDLTVRSWNETAERLTGIPAVDAVGRRCWEVLRGVGDDGSVICHAGCANARLAREGWPVGCQSLLVRAPTGRTRVRASTVSLCDGRFLHVLIPERPRDRKAPSLTPRQRTVLELIEDGLPAKAISTKLGVSVTTVRTHIRTLLRELGAHSQLEAVANARRLGVLAD